MSNRNRWYFYNGRVPVPVRLPDGRVYAVRPRGHIYTDKAGVRKYGSKFRPCAAPPNAEAILKMLSIEADHAPGIENLRNSKSQISTSVVELGKATSSRPAPEPPSAAPKSGSTDDSPEAPKRKRASRKRRVSAKVAETEVGTED